jgi:hypothetical protein
MKCLFECWHCITVVIKKLLETSQIIPLHSSLNEKELHSKKKICNLCLNINTKNQLLNINLVFKFYLCLNYAFLFDLFCCTRYFMTAIKYICIFNILICRLIMKKYVLSILLQHPVTAVWLTFWFDNRALMVSNLYHSIYFLKYLEIQRTKHNFFVFKLNTGSLCLTNIKF